MLWPTSGMLTTRRSRASRLASSATAGVTMPPCRGSPVISRIGQVIASTVSRQGGAVRIAPADVASRTARLNCALMSIQFWRVSGSYCGRSASAWACRSAGLIALTERTRSTPARATQRRAAAGGVRGCAKSRRRIAVPPARVLQGDAAQPGGCLHGDVRGGAGAHRVTDQRRPLQLKLVDRGQDVGGGALAEAVRAASDVLAAGRVEHHQVVVRPQAAGEA